MIWFPAPLVQDILSVVGGEVEACEDTVGKFVVALMPINSPSIVVCAARLASLGWYRNTMYGA
jgi:hypothetical protein